MSLERIVPFLFLAIEVLVAPLIFVALLAPPVGLVLALLVEASSLDTMAFEVVQFEALLLLLSGESLLLKLLLLLLLRLLLLSVHLLLLLLSVHLLLLLLSVHVLLLLLSVVVVICSGNVGNQGSDQGKGS